MSLTAFFTSPTEMLRLLLKQAAYNGTVRRSDDFRVQRGQIDSGGIHVAVSHCLADYALFHTVPFGNRSPGMARDV